MRGFGCSSFSWDTLDGRHLLGRTYDQFGNLDDNRIAIIPRGWSLQAEPTPHGQQPVTVKYSFGGMAVPGLVTPIMVDGINEKGLMGALLNFPKFADYKAQKHTADIHVHPGFLVAYLLGECATADEAAKRMEHVRLTDEPIFGQYMSVHYIFSDSSGETVVIEPDRTGLSIHRDTIGVLTNSPEYSWHMTNLCNYAMVTNLPVKPQTICGREIAVFGEKQGGGMGLPGDYTSPSRFVRIAFLKEYGKKGADEVEGISRMFHAFAVVDIPEGIVRGGREEEYEQTLCTSIMCCESRTYYFATSKNRRISAFKIDGKEKELTYYDLPKQEDIAWIK